MLGVLVGTSIVYAITSEVGDKNVNSIRTADNLPPTLRLTERDIKPVAVYSKIFKYNDTHVSDLLVRYNVLLDSYIDRALYLELKRRKVNLLYRMSQQHFGMRNFLIKLLEEMIDDQEKHHSEKLQQQQQLLKATQPNKL
jgi:hypothetical protein